MNKNIKPFILFSLILFAGLTVFAQPKEITAKEFDLVMTKAQKNLQDNAYRAKSSSQDFYMNFSTPAFSRIVFSEYVPPDRRRTIRMLEGEPESNRTETIWIGNKGYQRQGLKAWERITSDKFTGLVRDEKILEKNIVYKLIGKVIFNKLTANYYEVTTRKRYTVAENANNLVLVEKYWISKNGFLLKIVKEGKNVNDNITIPFRSTDVFEYDSRLKIKEPIIESNTKSL